MTGFVDIKPALWPCVISVSGKAFKILADGCVLVRNSLDGLLNSVPEVQLKES